MTDERAAVSAQRAAVMGERAAAAHPCDSRADRATAGADRATAGADRAAAGADRAAAGADQVRWLFDAKAATWSAKYAPGGPLAGRLTSLFAAMSRHAPPGGRVLDLGCGTGELARALVAVGLHAVGCDISAEMLRHASRNSGRQAGWVLLDSCWRRLPFAPAAFDVVVAASVLEYVDEPTAILRECARVLRPGGIVVCTVPDLRHPVRWLEWLARWAARGPQARAVGGHWPRLDGYLTYLAISRQRRSARWWRATAAGAGLLCDPPAKPAAERSPLRLFTFARPRDGRAL